MPFWQWRWFFFNKSPNKFRPESEKGKQQQFPRKIISLKCFSVQVEQRFENHAENYLRNFSKHFLEMKPSLNGFCLKTLKAVLQILLKKMIWLFEDFSLKVWSKNLTFFRKKIPQNLSLYMQNAFLARLLIYSCWWSINFLLTFPKTTESFLMILKHFPSKCVIGHVDFSFTNLLKFPCW